PVRLEQTDDDVGAGAPQRLGGGEHREGLAHTRRCAEEDLEPPALLAGGRRLDFGEKLLRIRTFALHRNAALPISPFVVSLSNHERIVITGTLLRTVALRQARGKRCI